MTDEAIPPAHVAPSWKHMVGLAWAGNLPENDIPAFAAAAQLAMYAAEAVPECSYCERLYAAVLIECFGVPPDAVSLSNVETQPVDDTLFAIGRAGKLMPQLEVVSMKAMAVEETCLALHAGDFPRAADGLLALANVVRQGGVFSRAEARFLKQALDYVTMIVPTFGLTRLEPIVAAASHDLKCLA